MRRRIIPAVKALSAAVLSVSLAISPLAVQQASAFPFGGGIVLDPSNLAQNILTATRTLQQVNNQIRQLQNEAQMLINDAKNLAQTGFDLYTEFNRVLNEIQALLNTAKAIEYTIADTDRVFRTHYPEDYSTWSETQMAASAEEQWKISRSAFHDALLVQSQIVQSVGADRATLDRLLAEIKSV